MSAVYDLIYTVPAGVFTVLVCAHLLFADTGSAALTICSVASSFIFVLLYHMKAKQRIILSGLILAVISGILLAGYGHMVSDNSWMIKAVLISAAAFILIRISVYSRYVISIMGAAGFITVMIRMFLHYREEKIVFCMLAVFLLAFIVETVQRRWKKEGDTGTKAHVVFIFPFLLPAIIAICLIDIPSRPYDWRHIRKLAYDIRNGYEILLQMISPEDGWDGGDNMGFSDKAVLGGRVSSDPYKAMTVTLDDAGDYRLYLAGKTFDGFDGTKWTKTDDTDMDYPVYDMVETVASVLQHDGGRVDDYLKKGRIRIRYEGMRTSHMFVLQKAFPTGDTEVILSGGDILFPHGGRGDYALNYYRVNRDDPAFTDILKEEKKIGKEAWDKAVFYYTAVHEREYSYADYEQYRKRIYEIYGQPVTLSDECRAFVDEKLRGARTDYERLERIEKMLSSYTYSASPGPLPETVQSEGDFADYFLLEKKEGYCTHFATAFVILARSCGIPARYVQGYSVLSGVKSFEVLSDRSHAWPEAYIDGVGWTVFEPTPGYRQVMGWDVSPDDHKDTAGIYDIKNDAEEVGAAAEEEAEEETPGVSRRWIRLSLMIFALFLLLFAALDRVVRMIRFAHMDERDKVITLCRKNMRMLRLTGVKQNTGETLSEFSKRVKGKVPSDVLGFTELYERALYAPGQACSGDPARMEEYVKACSLYVRRAFREYLTKKREKRSDQV